MKFRFLLFATLSLLLVAAISLIAYSNTRPLERTFHGKLVNLLPEAPADWTRTLRPIADTPEMQKAVGEMLNFDDGVFVDYTRGTERLSVYIAYWSPGKMSHRLVAGHTPDVCWVAAGWQCNERGTRTMEQRAANTNSQFPLPSTQLPAPRSLLPHAQTRTFTTHGSTEYVWFWHLVGGQPKSYGTGAEPPWYASIVDMIRKGLNQREEQFFIRLSSPQPLDNPALAPVLESVLRALPLCIKGKPEFRHGDTKTRNRLWHTT